MDNPLTVLAHIPRRARGVPRLYALYQEREKREETWRRFGSINVSFLLSGTGHYAADGVKSQVNAPCLFTQHPGIHTRYGPDGQWWECSLIYLAEEQAALERCACWPLPLQVALLPAQSDQLIADWQQLVVLVQTLLRQGLPADAVDSLALALLQRSLAQGADWPATDGDRAIAAIRRALDACRGPSPNLDQLAAQHGLSPAGFRRRWARVHAVSPAAYHLQQRLNEACQLLQETRTSVAQVAAALGFADPYYFSRIFKQKVGMSPSAFREHAQMFTAY